MRCAIGIAPAQNLTYTFRVNGANTGLTCTILAGQTLGTGTGTATIAPGSRIDIASPAAGNPGAGGSFSFS
jgi:hypothetical protein